MVRRMYQLSYKQQAEFYHYIRQLYEYKQEDFNNYNSWLYPWRWNPYYILKGTSIKEYAINFFGDYRHYIRQGLDLEEYVRMNQMVLGIRPCKSLSCHCRTPSYTFRNSIQENSMYKKHFVRIKPIPSNL